MKKYRPVLIIAILLFVLINVSDLWASRLGFYVIWASLLLAIVYVSLSIYLVALIYRCVKEKRNDKSSLLTIGLLSIILVTIFFNPFGITDLRKINTITLFIAQRESTANCLTQLTLNNRNTFYVNEFCFGSFETKGKYELKGDTIFFREVKFARGDSSFYEFATIRPASYPNKKIIGDIKLYKNKADTSPYSLAVTLNNLPH